MTTAADAHDQIRDILTWTQQIPDTIADLTGVRSPAVTIDGIRASRPRNLPFNLDAHADDLTQGPRGIRTARGVHDVLTELAKRISIPRGDHMNLSPGAYLLITVDWAEEHLDDWDDIADRIQATHRVVARLTGHTGDHHGTCPACGHTLTHATDDHGLNGRAHCPHCGSTYRDADELARDIRNAIQSLPAIQEDLDVSWDDLHRIYPLLTRTRLDKWTHRHRITPTGHDQRGRLTYRLGDVDALMGTPGA